MCVCMCVCVFVYVCKCVNTCVHVYKCVWAWVGGCLFMFVCLCVYARNTLRHAVTHTQTHTHARNKCAYYHLTAAYHLRRKYAILCQMSSIFLLTLCFHCVAVSQPATFCDFRTYNILGEFEMCEFATNI